MDIGGDEGEENKLEENVGSEDIDDEVNATGADSGYQ